MGRIMVNSVIGRPSRPPLNDPRRRDLREARKIYSNGYRREVQQDVLSGIRPGVVYPNHGLGCDAVKNVATTANEGAECERSILCEFYEDMFRL